MSIVESVDEMSIARTTATGADRKFSGQMSLGTSSKSRSLFVTNVGPFDIVRPADDVRDSIE